MQDTREHAASWYAATRTPGQDYAPLAGAQRCDVAVIGGGFTGVSAALHLAERGYDVALVEANRIGWGASGRNGGQLIDGFSSADKMGRRFGTDAAEIVRRMGLECRDLVVERIARHSIDCDLKFGFLDVAARAAEMRDLEADLAERRRYDYPHDLVLVPEQDLPTYIDSPAYIGGLVNRGNGHLHPLNLCLGEARAAAKYGARLYEQSRVLQIRQGVKPVLECESGTLSAQKIVVAGNAYIGNILPPLRRRLIPAGSYVIATEALDAGRAKALLPADMAYCEQCTALNYFRLSSDFRLLFGGMCNYSGRDPKDIATALRPRMLKVFPQFGDVAIDYQWGGYIGISVNRIPQFGRIGANIYFAQGYSGHGLAPTHLAGKMLADVVAGDSEQFDLFARVRHWPMPGGKWFANPALALGMLYFRLKELL